MDEISDERLTPERESEIRRTYYGNPAATKAITDLLGEIHALRARLRDDRAGGEAVAGCLGVHCEVCGGSQRHPLDERLDCPGLPAPAPVALVDLVRALETARHDLGVIRESFRVQNEGPNAAITDTLWAEEASGCHTTLWDYIGITIDHIDAVLGLAPPTAEGGR